MELHKCFPKFFSKILHILVLIVLLFFLPSAGFRDGRTSGWYQQFFPNLNGSTITSMTFLDSLTGYAVTNSNSLLQEYILKTTNGGDNWFINYTFNTPNSNWSFVKIGFINSNTGFAFSWAEMFKTTNGGNNWEMITNNLYCGDMAIINEDTILAVSSSGFDGGVYRTTNGGYNWQLIWGGGGSGMPSNIYMFNKNIGFNVGTSGMKRTSDGGFNWTAIPGESYTSIKFIDSLTGWKCFDSLKKSTNGGLNWFAQQTPNISHNFSNYTSFSILNKDTVWMVGARYFSHAPLYKTTNGGINWGYQIPDTTLQIYSFSFISFVNNRVGWASPVSALYEIHTVIGGNDTTFYMGINNNIISIPKNFILKQNYPNPFNSTSIIEYFLNTKGWVKLKIFDVRGKEIKTLVNEVQNAGTYGIPVSIELSSGIYFYRLQFITEKGEIQVDTKKMIVTK